MKKIGQVRMIRIAALFVAVLVAGFLIYRFSALNGRQNNIQRQGIVIGDFIRIRKEASSASEVIGVAEKDTIVEINGQVADSNGNLWYHVFVNGDTSGYIRSDLVMLLDETIPVE